MGNKGIIIFIIILILIIIIAILFFRKTNEESPLSSSQNNKTNQTIIPKYNLILSSTNDELMNYEVSLNNQIIKQGILYPSISEDLGLLEKNNYTLNYWSEKNYYLNSQICYLYSNSTCPLNPIKKAKVSLSANPNLLKINVSDGVVKDSYLCIGYAYPITKFQILNTELKHIEPDSELKSLSDICLYLGDLLQNNEIRYYKEGTGQVNFYFFDQLNSKNIYERGIKDYDLSTNI